MFKYLLIVEGIADIIFFRDYLKFLYIDLEVLEKKEEKEQVLKSENLEIIILKSEGYTSLSKIKTRIQENIDDDYTVLVIQDADDAGKDKLNGGVKLREKYLEKEKTKLKISFSIFLFPNHKDDGDLETLLLRITQDDKYKPFDNCHTKYIDCLENFLKEETIKDFRKEKNYIYTYLSLYEGHRFAKERDRSYGIDYWNFESDALIPLKNFFETHIVINRVTT